MDQAWWDSLNPLIQADITKNIEFVKSRWNMQQGDPRIDGNSLCPRCDSPYYRMHRLGKGMPRSDEPHYYGKRCGSCGYTFDPREVKDK